VASPVEQIKGRLNASEFIARDVRLQRSGRYLKGLCPFHDEKTPSFFVFEDRGTFRCFGCGEGGDVFTYVMRRDSSEFPDALRLLAAEAGVELSVHRRDPEAETHQRRTRAALEQAAIFMQGLLRESPQAKETRDYLRERGVSEQMIEAFRLGYAPPGGSPVTTHLRKLGTDPQVLGATGLAREDQGPTEDYFFNRLIFPISDRRGAVVGFGARALGDAMPKYLNTRENDTFHKGQHLYAFDMAAEAIRREATAVLVEGYMDAIAAHQFGFDNTIASMGTALTNDQGRLLATSGADRIVLALDADTAGAAATRRGVDVLRDVGRDASATEVDFRGLIRHEARLSVDIHVVELPAGEDPDSVIRADPERWRQLIEGSVPLADYYFRWALAEHDVSTIAGRRRAVTDLTPVIAEINEPVARAHYYERLAGTSGVPLEELRRAPLQQPPRASRPPLASAPRAEDRVEEGLLELVLQAPADAKHLVSRIDPSHLSDPTLRHLLSTVLQQAQGTSESSWQVLLDELDDQSRERVQNLRARIAQMPALEGTNFVNALQFALLRLRERRVLEELREIAAIEDAPAAAARSRELGAQKHSIEMAIRELSVFTRTPSVRSDSPNA
jgi:DNA primase